VEITGDEQFHLAAWGLATDGTQMKHGFFGKAESLKF
jgi:hypothetical protein